MSSALAQPVTATVEVGAGDNGVICRFSIGVRSAAVDVLCVTGWGSPETAVDLWERLLDEDSDAPAAISAAIDYIEVTIIADREDFYIFTPSRALCLRIPRTDIAPAVRGVLETLDAEIDKSVTIAAAQSARDPLAIVARRQLAEEEKAARIAAAHPVADATALASAVEPEVLSAAAPPDLKPDQRATAATAPPVEKCHKPFRCGCTHCRSAAFPFGLRPSDAGGAIY